MKTFFVVHLLVIYVHHELQRYVGKEQSRLYKHYSSHYASSHRYYHLHANNLPNRHWKWKGVRRESAEHRGRGIIIIEGCPILRQIYAWHCIDFR